MPGYVAVNFPEMSLYLGALVLLKKCKLQNKMCHFWVHPINQRRLNQGEFHHLCFELRSHEDRFFSYFCMSPAEFDYLVQKICPFVQGVGSNFRESISVQQKLSVCLQ